MLTLAFFERQPPIVIIVEFLVCGAVLWRLIWAILVTPRLNQIPPLFGRIEPGPKQPEARVLIREAEPDHEPEFECIEVIAPRESLPSPTTHEGISRPALGDGNRSIVRRRTR